MQNRHSTTILQILVLLGISFFVSSVHAFQMGEMNSQSRVGEPLNASLSLWLSPNEKRQSIRFKISPDLSYISNTKLTAIVNRLEARLVDGPNGSSYVNVSTATPIAEPIVAFRLKVYVGDDARMRNFALALTPTPTARRPQVAAPKTKPRRATTTRTPIDDPTYIVSRGDTLWEIAERVAQTSGGNTASLVQDIFAANPNAFVNGNQNRLMLGATLILPVAVATINEPVAEPAALESEQVDPSSSDPPFFFADEIDSATDVIAQPIAGTTTRTPVKWQERNPELAAELEALKQKYAALRARYEIQSSQPRVADIDPPAPADVVVIETPMPSELQAVDDSLTVSPTALPVVEQLQSETPITSASSATSADPVVTSEGVGMAAYLQSLKTFWTSIPFLSIFGSIFAVGLVVLLYRVAHQAIVTRRNRRATQQHHAAEEDRKAEVGRKAKNRIEMETEVQRMLEQRGDNGLVASAPESPAPDMGVAPVTEESLETTIDLNIAHGRYAEAETLLAEVIATTPRNYSAKLRLIEVFYMTEQIDEFCQLAKDLHQNHRADMADEEWRRVIRMGKIIAPDTAPFSGPRSVSNSNQAS